LLSCLTGLFWFWGGNGVRLGRVGVGWGCRPGCFEGGKISFDAGAC